jgi:hypothetical protein
VSGERHALEWAVNVLPLITTLVAARPTYGYRQIIALTVTARVSKASQKTDIAV